MNENIAKAKAKWKTATRKQRALYVIGAVVVLAVVGNVITALVN